ncbi:MAG: hypothetical protein WCF84_17570, partial [Anaerolineae bacterium]
MSTEPPILQTNKRPGPLLWVLVLALASLFGIVCAYQIGDRTTIDIGSGQDTPLIQGFSFRETLPSGGNFRWSGPRAEIRFWGIGNQDGVLTVYLAAPRPSGQAHVQVLGNGQL